MSARYLNVDCILQSNHSLDELIAFLDDNIFLLWSESSEAGFRAGIETNLINTQSPDQDISEFLRLFNSLPQHLLQLLIECEEKVFDIGFEINEEGEAFDTHLDASTIGDIHRLGFSVSIRIYPLIES